MIIHNTWRFFDSGIGSAEWNMAVDEALLANFSVEDMPIFRLYGWKNALSFGRFSKISTNLDMKKVQSSAIPYVRRFTGGGILVHGGDLSYTMITPRDWLREKGVRESYRDICQFLIDLYQGLGYDANFTCDTDIQDSRSDICFKGFESYDIIINGKKMGGNAQRHTSQALFQHGTIPMKIDSRVFNPLFLENANLDNVATLEQLGTSLTYDELSKRVQKAFLHTFDAQFSSDTLRPMEEEVARKLLNEKYSQNEWNLYGK